MPLIEIAMVLVILMTAIYLAGGGKIILGIAVVYALGFAIAHLLSRSTTSKPR